MASQGEVTVQILNQSRDSSHLSRTVDWDQTDGDAAAKPLKNRRKSARGLGFSQFISHAGLEKETKGYLKNDCIYVRVQKVSFPKQWLACSVVASNEPNSTLPK
jgi:hypothetical protein